MLLSEEIQHLVSIARYILKLKDAIDCGSWVNIRAIQERFGNLVDETPVLAESEDNQTVSELLEEYHRPSGILPKWLLIELRRIEKECLDYQATTRLTLALKRGNGYMSHNNYLYANIVHHGIKACGDAHHISKSLHKNKKYLTAGVKSLVDTEEVREATHLSSSLSYRTSRNSLLHSSAETVLHLRIGLIEQNWSIVNNVLNDIYLSSYQRVAAAANTKMGSVKVGVSSGDGGLGSQSGVRRPSSLLPMTKTRRASVLDSSSFDWFSNQDETAKPAVLASAPSPKSAGRRNSLFTANKNATGVPAIKSRRPSMAVDNGAQSTKKVAVQQQITHSSFSADEYPTELLNLAPEAVEEIVAIKKLYDLRSSLTKVLALTMNRNAIKGTANSAIYIY